MQREQTAVVIVGAGPAGLAVGACLQQAHVSFLILEQADRVGPTWHRHYARLHLHTDKRRSALPFFPYPKHYPTYPSRAQLIDYLESYARHFKLQPRFGQKVLSIAQVDEEWHTRTVDAHYVSPFLVIASGYNREPHVPSWPGQASFRGAILHSSAYQNGRSFAGKAVLVVGFGNSGGEIAIDLWEHGAKPALAVRSPVNIIPRDLLGLPILAHALLLRRLPARLADLLVAPVLYLLFGELRLLGLRKLPYGPFVQIQRKARIPLIDVGTVKLIRAGQLHVYPAIDHFEQQEICFVNGQRQAFDAVILATGYRPSLAAFFGPIDAVVDEQGEPRVSGCESALPGLYFCGFRVVATGMLREIALEAKRIAQEIASGLAR